MCALSNRIREKSNWWEKVKDETVVERWREEVLQQVGDDERPERKLTPGMVSPPPVFPLLLSSSTQCLKIKYVLEELQGYAALRDPETGIEARFNSRSYDSWTDIASVSRLARQSASGGLISLSRIRCERNCSQL